MATASRNSQGDDGRRWSAVGGRPDGWGPRVAHVGVGRVGRRVAVSLADWPMGIGVVASGRQNIGSVAEKAKVLLNIST